MTTSAHDYSKPTVLRPDSFPMRGQAQNRLPPLAVHRLPGCDVNPDSLDL